MTPSLKNFKRFIIVDSDNTPMAWSAGDKQLVYCHNVEWQDDPFPVKSYSRVTANKHIFNTIKNRKKWKMHEGNYKLMPIA